MFFLAQMSDTVSISPHQFSRNFEDAVKDVLNGKFANKVVLNVGLCICLFDIEKLHDSIILPGDGACHTKVEFRYVVFRPFVDEVIVARIKSCTRDGLQMTMGFFDDIFIPANRLQENSRFSEKDQVWIWNYEVEDGPSAEMFMEPGAVARFRVTEEQFQDTVPSPTEALQAEDPTAAANLQAQAGAEASKPSYAIMGSMAEPGLGCLSWWS